MLNEDFAKKSYGSKAFYILLRYQYDIIIFLFLSFQLFITCPMYEGIETMFDWCTTSYALTYKLGFASRLFMGSLLNLFVPYLSAKFLWLFIFASLLILNFLLALYLGSCIRASDRKIHAALFLLIALYLAAPNSLGYLYHFVNFGRLDLFLFIFTMLSLFCIRNKYLKFLVPVFLMLSVATHQVFLFTFFPLILGALGYYAYENHFSLKSIGFCHLSLALTIISFIFFQFFSKIYPASVDEVIQIIRPTTNLPINEMMIEYEYFRTILGHKDGGLFISKERMELGLSAIGLMAPLSGIFIYIFLKARTFSGKGKNYFCAAILLPLCSLPAFFLTSDWGRWFGAAYTVQFLIIFYLVRSGCEPIIKALEKVSPYIKNHLLIFLILILYFNVLGKFETNKVLNTSVYIVDFIKNFL